MGSDLVTMRTMRLSGAESAAAFVSDLFGMAIEPMPDGRWVCVPQSKEIENWGIEPQPIVRTGREIMEEASYHGWQPTEAEWSR